MQMISRMFAEAGADHWKRAATMLNERAALLKPLGIEVGYHNHNVEFVDAGKGMGWDVLQAETGGAVLLKRGMLRTAPNAPASGNSVYGYFDLTLTL